MLPDHAHEQFQIAMLLAMAGLGLGISVPLFRLTTLGRQLATIGTLCGLLCLSFAVLGIHLSLVATACLGALPLVFFVALVGNNTGQRLLQWMQKPCVLGGTIFLASAGFGVYASSHYDHTIDQSFRTMEEELEIVNRRPTSAPVENLHVTTDRGTPIRVTDSLAPRNRRTLEADEKVAMQMLNRGSHTIQIEPARDGSNCHGWTFTQNRYAIANQAVDLIVRENGYEVVSKPLPGDLVVYRDVNGELSHTAVVRYVAPGQPVLVEGKWGWMGVYLHDVEKSCYGTNYTFFRSPRPSHVLRGLDGQTANPLATK